MQAMEAENGHHMFTFVFTFSFAYTCSNFMSRSLSFPEKTDELLHH